MSAGSAMSAVELPPRLRRAIERRGRVSPEGRLIFRGRLVTFMHYDKRAKPAQGAWPGGTEKLTVPAASNFTVSDFTVTPSLTCVNGTITPLTFR